VTGLLPYWRWSGSERNIVAPWRWHCFVETCRSHRKRKIKKYIIQCIQLVNLYVNLNPLLLQFCGSSFTAIQNLNLRLIFRRNVPLHRVIKNELCYTRLQTIPAYISRWLSVIASHSFPQFQRTVLVIHTALHARRDLPLQYVCSLLTKKQQHHVTWTAIHQFFKTLYIFQTFIQEDKFSSEF
jgi:hypothetical protein